MDEAQTITSQQVSPPTVQQMPAQTPVFHASPMTKLLLSVIVFLFVVLCISGVYIFAQNQKTQTTKQQALIVKNESNISGTLDINGLIPQGATIRILARKFGDDSFKTVVSSLPAVDGGSWGWDNAEKNYAYQLEAELLSSGAIVGTSNVITVAAPADSEILRLNSTIKPQIPTPTPTASEPSATPLPSVTPIPTPTPMTMTSMSGTVGIDGYIPPGSMVAILVEAQNATQFSQVVSNVPASDGAGWTWAGATQGTIYNVQAVLQSSGATIASSTVSQIAAPAVNELFNINSPATPPAPVTTGVSGTINFNGSVPGNSYITLGIRPTGTGAFNQVSTNLQAADGTVWSWNGATSGVSYDIQAYLWVNSQPYAESQILTIPAPASGEVLTINMTSQPSGPSASTINASCGSQQNNLNQVTINYNVGGTLGTAQAYQVTVGTASQGSNVYSTTVTPSNPNQQQSLSTTYSLTPGVTYYVQYAYSTCAQCGTFSPFSPSIQITCNN